MFAYGYSEYRVEGRGKKYEGEKEKTFDGGQGPGTSDFHSKESCASCISLDSEIHSFK